MRQQKITTTVLLEMKARGEKIAALTAYDAPTSALLNESGIDIVLVGDSVGNVKLGYANTLPVTLAEILHHTQAAARGNSRAMLVADMPYLTYQLSIQTAKENAGKLIKEGGAHAVKVEGGLEIANAVKALCDLHIPVMGHLGLTPQYIHKIGGYTMQGKTPSDRNKIVTDAKILEGAGVFALVLECIPADLAQEITAKVNVPTIGIGSGPHCNGQILVIDDMLGLSPDPLPKFVKTYARLRLEMQAAIQRYSAEVKSGAYPEGKSAPQA